MSGGSATGVVDAVERMAAVVGRHADYRVLRRLLPMRRNQAEGVRGGMLIGCAVDVETTGLDLRRDAIIELALQRFWARPDGRILITGKPHSWLEDPGRPLSAEIVRLTGISDDDVAGRRIMDPVAAALIADADFVVAHNAAFDRPFVEKRLPYAAGLPWVCSMRDVDWRRHGFEGRTLSHLLMQMGWFFDAHRASTDVTALLHLLDHPLPRAGTVLREAVLKAASPGWRFDAVGAPFEAKELLKARGYRWNPEGRLWSCEVPASRFDEEYEWIVLEVYGGLAKPRFSPVTWRERHGAA